LNSARLTSSGDISGGIRATATSTIQGTIAATSGAIAVSGADLTISNTTSGAVYFSPDTGRTITQSGDISATAFGNIGSGKLLISGNITSTQPLNVYSGTTTINTATSTVSSGNLFFRGSSAAINLRSSYSNGIIEFDNTGAVGSNSVTITTSQSSLAVTSAKLRLVRSAAQPLSVSFRVPFAAGLAGAVGATGLLTFEYGGTVGTIGTDSSIIVDIASGRIPYSIISDGSAFVPAYSDSTVVKAPTYGSTTGFNTQSGAATISSTGDDQNANITGSITNQSTATMSSIRLASNSADVTIGGGNTLTVPLIMDMGTGVTRTIVSGGTIAVDPANGLNGRTLTIYTNNTSGSTISSNISVNEAVTNYLVKAGSGLLNISGNFDQYGFLSIVDGDLAFTSGSTFNTYGATVNFSNPASTTNSLKIQSSGESFVAGFVGGGPNTAISLEGGDVKVGYFSTTSYAGSISRTGAQKLRLFRISMTHSGDLAVPLEFLGGTFTVDRLNGATVTGSPTLTFNGGTITVTSNSTDYAYSTTFGAASVPSGRAGITLSSAAPPTGAQVLTLASLSRSARSAVLFTHTASTTAQLVITAQAAGSIGPWAFNGSNFAYYRTSGTYAGGGTVSTASVDDPIYGTDTNFLASVGAGTTFGATTSTDNINVTGAISAQTTASVNTIRSSSSITISGAGVISTNAVLGTATMSMAGASGFIQPVSGGELVLYGQTGTLTVSTGIQDNGVTPTNVIRTGTTTVTGTKTYTGSTTFLSGTGNIASDGALGTAPGSPTANIYMSGGSLNITASVTINSNRSMVLSDGVSALTTTGTGNVTYNGVISGSGTLTLGNNGIGITLGGTNTFTGGSHIGAGTITITNPSALGSGLFTMGTGTLTFGAGGGFDISSQLAPLANLPYSFTNSSGSSITFASSFGASGSSFTKGGANDIVLSADNYFSGNVTVSAGGALVVSSSGALGYTTGTNSVTVSSTASLVLDGVNTLSFQNRQFTIAGVGTATYPGALWAKSGSPTFSNSITANTTPVIGSASTGLFTISGGVFGTANITYRADGTGGIRQTGVISGAGRTLTKSGNEKLTLAPATSNTYTGLTTISAGTIVAETESPSTVAPIPAALTVSSGARLTAPTGTLQKGRLNITGTLTLNSGIVRIGA
jgi:autotransporter-associated beta strand protein